MLPRQTNRIRTALSYAVAAALKTGAHRALIVRMLAARLLGRHTAGGLGRVEPGLRRCPLVTLVLVVRLLIRGLTVVRIDKQIIARRCLGARTLIIRRLYDFITIFCVAPRIVSLVGVVVRESADPHRGVKRRQHRHEDARWPHRTPLRRLSSYLTVRYSRAHPGRRRWRAGNWRPSAPARRPGADRSRPRCASPGRWQRH